MFRRRTAAILARELDGELLLLDTESERIHQLNATAALIWRCCESPSSPEAIAEALVQEFDVSTETATRDVLTALQKLKDVNLVLDVTATQL